jgi:hypothetical protein
LVYGPDAVRHLNAIMVTVNTLLRRNTANHSSTPLSSVSTPTFFLAYMRTGSVPLEDVWTLAEVNGFVVSSLEDYTFDIFGNGVTVESMFWADTILSFSRISTPIV